MKNMRFKKKNVHKKGDKLHDVRSLMAAVVAIRLETSSPVVAEGQCRMSQRWTNHVDAGGDEDSGDQVSCGEQQHTRLK